MSSYFVFSDIERDIAIRLRQRRNEKLGISFSVDCIFIGKLFEFTCVKVADFHVAPADFHAFVKVVRPDVGHINVAHLKFGEHFVKIRNVVGIAVRRHNAVDFAVGVEFFQIAYRGRFILFAPFFAAAVDKHIGAVGERNVNAVALSDVDVMHDKLSAFRHRSSEPLGLHEVKRADDNRGGYHNRDDCDKQFRIFLMQFFRGIHRTFDSDLLVRLFCGFRLGVFGVFRFLICHFVATTTLYLIIL